MEAQYTKALPEMDLGKAEMLASVSHELRSPLTSIKGYAATLLRHERRISHEERHEFLVAITEASDRLAVVIDRLLEMSQLEADNVELEYSSINLAYLVREALTAIQQCRSRVQHLTTFSHIPAQVTFALRLEDRDGIPTDEELLIQADRYYLRKVLDNLLVNACSYSPEGGTVEVVVRPVSIRECIERMQTLSAFREDKSNGKASECALLLQEDQQMVEIRVHDTGIGISGEHLERIFERFHRIDTRLTREVTGLGLGLAICKRIVELHHGFIWAESEVGQGSTFHVLLPVDGWA